MKRARTIFAVSLVAALALVLVVTGCKGVSFVRVAVVDKTTGEPVTNAYVACQAPDWTLNLSWRGGGHLNETWKRTGNDNVAWFVKWNDGDRVSARLYSKQTGYANYPWDHAEGWAFPLIRIWPVAFLKLELEPEKLKGQ